MSADTSPHAGSASGFESLKTQLKQINLQSQETSASMGKPERAFIIFNPTREQMFELGRQFGQEAVIFGANGKHELIHTNGSLQGKFHPSEVQVQFFKDRPSDYFIQVPQLGYIRITFNGDKLLDSPLAHLVHQEANTPNGITQNNLHKSEPTGHKPHPNSYPWHDSHTSDHPKTMGLGIINHYVSQIPFVKSEQDQDSFSKAAQPFGNIVKGKGNLESKHYPYQGKSAEIQRLVKDHGFEPFMVGSKHGKPGLNNKNYDTSHLPIHDSDSGDENHDDYSRSWRHMHELAHALSEPEVNKIYGHGSRNGKLGHHLNSNEALRAVHWEDLTVHKQRELSKKLGIHIPEEHFNKERNEVLADAVHRVTTGKVSDPNAEGFRPYSHKIPLETALGMVREHGRNLGLQGLKDKLRKGETPVSDKQLSPSEALHVLAKSLKDQFEALNNRELKKAEDMGGGMPAGSDGALGLSEAVDKSDNSCVGPKCLKCEKYHPSGRCEKRDIPNMKAEEAADRKDMSGQGPMCKMCKSYHPVGMCKHQKSEDYIDKAHESTPREETTAPGEETSDPRIKEVPNKHKGVLPGDKKSKVVETSGGVDVSSELSKAENGLGVTPLTHTNQPYESRFKASTHLPREHPHAKDLPGTVTPVEPTKKAELEKANTVPMAKPPGGAMPSAPSMSKPSTPKVGGMPTGAPGVAKTMKSLAEIRKSASVKVPHSVGGTGPHPEVAPAPASDIGGLEKGQIPTSQGDGKRKEVGSVPDPGLNKAALTPDMKAQMSADAHKAHMATQGATAAPAPKLMPQGGHTSMPLASLHDQMGAVQAANPFAAPKPSPMANLKAPGPAERETPKPMAAPVAKPGIFGRLAAKFGKV
jgi:hypothetical protein